MLKIFKRMFSVILCMILLTSTMCCTLFLSSAAKIVDSYTVLVLDTSGSMSGDPIVALQDVAKRFCASLLGADSVNEIAIVDFDTSCTYISFTSDYSTLKSKIESLESGGSTNMYDALTTADSLLSNVSASATRNIVLLSDGVPQSGTKSDDGPYEKGTGVALFGQYHKYANAVYNLMEEYKQTYDVYTVGFFHKSTSSLASELLNDINNKGYYDAQNASDLTFMFSNIANNIKKKLPKSYDFYRDSYSFENYSDNIDNTYFQTLYGRGQGFDLWREQHNQGGVCFGMTYTTASLINGFPDCDNIRALLNTSEGMFSASSTIKVGNKYISIRDYIKYAHIYQFSSEFQSHSTWSDINTIYNLVENYLSNNQIGVTIGMTRLDGTGGHRVLAVGVDGNDILIDDPNNSDDFERITVGDNGNWSFSGLAGWNNDTCAIRYSLDYHVPYSLLLTGKTVSTSSNNNETESYINGMDILDKNNLLLTVKGYDCTIENNNLIEIISDDYAVSNSKTIRQYWLLDDNSIKVSNINENSNEIRLASENSILQTKITDACSLSMTVGEDDTSIDINSTIDNNYEFSFIAFDTENDDPKEICIMGTASSDTVTASKTENGVVVTGLNDITVTYSEDDVEIAKTTASVEDGREVNITVDESNDTVKTDFVNENACEYCGKVHGNTFIEMLIEFIHMLLSFFEKILK